MATTSPRPQVPLQIKFIDPIRPVKMGRELRFEVTRTDRPTERVSFDQLDFAFAPVMWGVVGPGAEPGTGIVKVVALAKSRDVYDKPKYEMTATYKARGDTSLEAGNLFALALAAPVVEILFFVREDDPSTPEEYEPFDPQAQSSPLKSTDLRVDPPHVADLFEQGGKFYARILDSSRAGKLTVTFPNGEKAQLSLDVRLAGKRPEELERLASEPQRDDEGDEVEPLRAPAAPPAAPPEAPAFSQLSQRPAPPPFSVIPGGRGDNSGTTIVNARPGSILGEETEHTEPDTLGEETRPRAKPETRADAAAQSAAMPSAASMPPTPPAAPTSPAGAASAAPTSSAPSSSAPAASPGGAPSRAPSPAAGGAKVDPSYTLRSNMQQLRREIDSALGDGLIPTGARSRLQQRVAFFRDAAKHYKGPDVASVQDFFERTLGDVQLGG